MNSVSAVIMGFAILVAFSTVSFCKPSPLNAKDDDAGSSRPASRDVNDARKLWSEAKKAHKEIHRQMDREARRRRSQDNGAGGDGGEDGGEDGALYRSFESLVNATGKRYMLDLYKQLSNSSVGTRLTQANTIKSLNYERLPASFDNKTCNFKFSLTGITSYEFVLQTKLRLYMERLNPQSPTYIVTIKVVQPNGKKSTAVIQEVSSKQNGYVEFDVAEIFRVVIGQEKDVIFVVDVYKSPSGVESMTPLDCWQDIHFVNSHLDENKIPVLVVYSFERSEKNVNITETTELVRQQQRNINRSQDTSRQLQRRRRTAQHQCTRLDLSIDTAMIPPNLIGNYDTFTIIAPKNYDAGICGGNCVSNIAHEEAKRHPLLLNILIRQSLINRPPYVYGQCCAPIAYNDLFVLGVANNVPMIHTIPNMKVTKCACTDIVR